MTNGAAVNVNYTPTVATSEAPKTTAADPWGNSPSGNQAPTADQAPAAPAAPAHAVTCEDVATKAAELIGAEAEERAKSISSDEVAELKVRLESQLPAAMQQILAECAKENWSDAARTCVIDAKDLATASSCQ